MACHCGLCKSEDGAPAVDNPITLPVSAALATVEKLLLSVNALDAHKSGLIKDYADVKDSVERLKRKLTLGSTSYMLDLLQCLLKSLANFKEVDDRKSSQTVLTWGLRSMFPPVYLNTCSVAEEQVVLAMNDVKSILSVAANFEPGLGSISSFVDSHPRSWPKATIVENF